MSLAEILDKFDFYWQVCSVWTLIDYHFFCCWELSMTEMLCNSRILFWTKLEGWNASGIFLLPVSLQTEKATEQNRILSSTIFVARSFILNEEGTYEMNKLLKVMDSNTIHPHIIELLEEWEDFFMRGLWADMHFDSLRGSELGGSCALYSFSLVSTF